MKIAVVSDSHTLHDNIVVEPCDLFIFAGDYSHRGGRLNTISFFEWLRTLPAKQIVFIGGNHDLSLDKKLMLNRDQGSLELLLNTQKYGQVQDLIKHLPPHIHYLEDTGVEIEGIKIWGSPVSPSFGYGWAFNKDKGTEIQKVWSKIPKDTDILITHSPCYGILDWVEDRLKRHPDEDQHVGCKDLYERIKKIPSVKYHISGHIHENWGIQCKRISNTRHVTFINGAVVDNRNQLLHKQPIYFYYK